MKDWISDTPIRRDTVTSASRIMLPAYVIQFFVVGVNFTFTDPEYLNNSPSLGYADGFLGVPLWGWGILLLSASIVLAGSLMTHERLLSRFSLYFAMICMILLGIVFLGAAIFSNASFTAASWPFFVATACRATERSLRNEEVS